MTNASTLTFEKVSAELELLAYQITARLSSDGRSTRWAWVNHVTLARGVSRGSKADAERDAWDYYANTPRHEKQACIEFGKQAVRNLVMSGARVELGKADAKHAYQVGVSLIGALDVVSSVQENATNRNQACSIAEAYGFNVRDVNIIG